MTGPEHYRKAEERLKDAASVAEDSKVEHYLLASAQVHATLALAAATAHHTVPTSGVDRAAWRAVVGAEDEGDVTVGVW